jgi:transcriptional regulator of nitric oxide reductase
MNRLLQRARLAGGRLSRMRRHPAALALLIGASTSLAAEQSLRSRPLPDLVKHFFPAATTVTPKSGVPPRFTALQNDSSGAAKPIGVAFLTTDLEPLERGYHGPIRILVGLQPNGKLAGVVVMENQEPYGYFSVDLPAFAAQFAGKDIHDPFKVGQDVDAVSRASITINSATRAIRNAARRVAAQAFAESK